MAEYLLSVHDVEGREVPAPDVIEQIYADVDRFNEEVKAEGAWVFAGGLEPPSTATVVESRNGEVLMTDGPYSETKEYLGGFWVIEAPDLDAALKYAARGSEACRAPVEVRPFQSEPED
jgi:hypothetical protein